MLAARRLSTHSCHSRTPAIQRRQLPKCSWAPRSTRFIVEAYHRSVEDCVTIGAFYSRRIDLTKGR
jgi:hypothetical protein